MTQLPWYLKQSDEDLKLKFNFIQNQEDVRLREATNGHNEDSRWSLGVSIHERNDYRNRYVNIMTYERNRVHLNVLEGNDYVNASYVKLDVAEEGLSPGYYIATQGPTKHSWDQFWQMCYDECPWNDIVIVMVTPLREYNRDKCYPYWPRGKPSSESENNDVKFVSRQVQNPGGNSRDESVFTRELAIEFVESQRIDDQYTLTTLTLTPSDKREPVKTVHHFYFDQWKDMSKPQEVFPIMKLCKHSHNLNSVGNPIIVHCSAGVGRSGTFIALDYLVHGTKDFQIGSESSGSILTPIKSYKRDLVEQIVLQLRAQRMKMVQTEDQFKFIYHAARYFYSNPNKQFQR